MKELGKYHVYRTGTVNGHPMDTFSFTNDPAEANEFVRESLDVLTDVDGEWTVGIDEVRGEECVPLNWYRSDGTCHVTTAWIVEDER